MKINIFSIIFFISVTQQVSCFSFASSSRDGVYGENFRGDIKKTRVYPSSSSSSDNVDFQYFYRLSSSGKIGNIDNNTVLKSGDCHRIEFTPNCNNCYVYIIKYDQHDQIKMLFPTSENDYNLSGLKIGTNPITSGKTYFVPGQNNNDNGYFCLDNNVGFETVHFIVSKTPRKRLVASYRGLLNSYSTGNKQQIALAENTVTEQTRGDVRNTKFFKERDGNGRVTNITGVECDSALGCQKSIVFKHQ
ncbi:MAG: DUF4384 domain-containing protein [Candidatus Marithrix sp.]